MRRNLLLSVLLVAGILTFLWLSFQPPPASAEITAAIIVIVEPPRELFTDENGSTDSFSIVLDSAPSSNVTVELTSSDLTEGTVSPSSVIFTHGNWDKPELIEVTGVPDGIQDGDVLYQIFGLSSSSDPLFDGLEMPAVSITNINDALPIANDDYPPIDGFAPITVPVLQNDSALDDTPLQLSIVSDPSNGSAVVNPAPENTITYTPFPSFTGLDQFSYSVCDGDGDCAGANVKIEDQTPPTLTWIAPVETGGTFELTDGEIKLEVEVMDNFQANCVKFLQWDALALVFNLLGEVCQPPYAITIDSGMLNFAWNQIFAQASDLAGNLSEFDTIWLFRWNNNYLPIVSR
jgi:hypothetical protein